eukprot:8597486-Lingulodinium_polyedra.AAC.1
MAWLAVQSDVGGGHLPRCRRKAYQGPRATLRREERTAHARRPRPAPRDRSVRRPRPSRRNPPDAHAEEKYPPRPGDPKGHLGH